MITSDQAGYLARVSSPLILSLVFTPPAYWIGRKVGVPLSHPYATEANLESIEIWIHTIVVVGITLASVFVVPLLSLRMKGKRGSNP
jgi:hypothetical protein